MLFPTVTFAVFFVAVFVTNLALRSRPRAWKLAMIGASYLFYGWWDWRFCGLLAASTVANWVFGYAVQGADRSDGRGIVGVAVIVNVGLLGLFKYYGFFVEAVASSIGSTGPLPLLDLVLPVGISFFTFQALSYVIDIQRHRIEGRPLIDFALYLSFFPQLVAGPIVRATEFLPQLDRLRPDDEIAVSEAAWLIGRGLFKKTVIATYLATTVVDPVFAAPTTADRTDVILAFYGYAVQIYADFSGYTDIAIGIALLLGFRFPQNFDNPYRARSVQDFWRRWHMTLSRWLRDYLYVPLGGNRISSLATYRNLLATMILGGLWHGAAWTFVAWGALHGLALATERLLELRADRTERLLELRADRTERLLPARWLGPVAGWLVTFHVVCGSWILFRAADFSTAVDVAQALLTAPGLVTPDPLPVLIIAGALAVQLIPPTVPAQVFARFAALDPAIQSVAVGLWLFLVTALGPAGVAPFIYFQF